MSKVTRYVIKGISYTTKPDQIRAEIQSLGYIVINVTNMTSWVTKKPLPIFQILVEVQQSNDITILSQLLYHKIKAERCIRKRTIPQCSNCQVYKHTGGRCKSQPKYRFCAGNHKTANCDSSDISPTCCNCSG